ncbi:MAG: MurT ligase domain-containing protein, partial [Methanobacteriaceae archaeon]
NKNITKNITKIKFGYMGLYNAYNCIGAIAFAHEIGIPIEFIKERIENFDYKLGRMETLDFKDKKVTLVLTKNPVGLSEVLNSISYDTRSKAIMFMLNDHGADGKDISWIWDANLEKINEINNIKKFYATGIRAEESALRIKYAGLPLDKIKIIPSKSKNVNDIAPAIKEILKEDVEVVYILGTYTATPEIRKALLKEQ